MLSVGRLGAGQEGYYLDAVAKGIDEYYTVRGEVAGRWVGDGSARLGLMGRVEGAPLRAVLAGEHPETGEQLASSARKVWAFDLTFSAPKSVSVLFALGGWELRRELIGGHEAAVDAALGYLEREALFSRRGHAGMCRVTTDGFVAAAFRHRTSRAGDPQLHTHVVAANLAHGLDGDWGTLDSRSLYRHARTAGYLYQAHLRAELHDRLGVAWRPVVKGSAELEGVPERVLREFSRRRAEIQGLLAEQGESSRGAAQLATLVTRGPKDPGVALVDLHHDWAGRAAALGFGPERLSAVLDRLDSEVDWPSDSVGLGEELTWEHSSFDRRDVLRALAARAAAGMRVSKVEQAADTFLEGAAVVPLGAGRWTTPDMLRIETALIRNALARRSGGFGLTGLGALTRALAADRGLASEQVQMVRRLLDAGDGVDVVVGLAGAGKTRALGVATRAWRDIGYRVIGTALAARTANQLSETTGAEPVTITRLLLQLDHEGSGRLAGSVVVVDEAGMVGTRQLARLMGHAQAAHAKVVLVGDPHQLPEIEAGGAFATLARRLDASELHQNRRQRDPAERAALANLRAGSVQTSVAQLVDAGRVTVADTADDARTQMAHDWLTGRRAGQDVIMLARRRSDVTKLNAAARSALMEHGEIALDGVHVDGQCFAVGDRVMTLRNDSALGVANGDVATIGGIDHRRNRLVLRHDNGTETTLTEEYLDAGHLTHAYATTIHKAQGLTSDIALVLADDSFFRETGYTALSRGRTRNQLYLVAGDVEDGIEWHAPERNPREPIEGLVAAFARSGAKQLALDVVERHDRSEASPEIPDTGMDIGW